MRDEAVQYTPEVKRQMVAPAQSGRTPASLSREFGVSAVTAGSWTSGTRRIRWGWRI